MVILIMFYIVVIHYLAVSFRMKMQSPAPIILMKAGIGQNVSCPVDYLTYKYLGLCIHGDVASLGIYVTHLVRPGIC